MLKCPGCEKQLKNYTALSMHFRKTHGTTQQLAGIMRLRLIAEKHGGEEPKCACGCGGTPKYYDYDRGYSEFVHGHHSRVKNNWGHNKEAQQKSQNVRREMHDRGEIRIWNKGETKETDERIAAYGNRISATLKTDPECQKQRSEHMAGQWRSGNLTPLTGPDHPMWKGGASALQPIVRARLHAVWTYPKLRASGFRCSRCDAPGPGLEVHHDGERFADILQKAIGFHGEVDPTRSDDDFERKDAIADWVAAYHVQERVSGVALCPPCHEAAHAAA